MLVGATGFEPVRIYFSQPAVLLHSLKSLDFTVYFSVYSYIKIDVEPLYCIPMQHEMQHNFFHEQLHPEPCRIL